MKKPAAAMTAVVLVAGIAAMYQWFQLRAERERGGELAARVEALEMAQPAPVPAAPEALSSPPAIFAQPEPPVQVAAASAVAQAPRTEPARNAPQPPATAMLEAMQSPEGRDFTRSMMRGMMAQMYPDLATQLELTPEETGKLFDLIASQQDGMAAESMSLMAGSADPAVARELQRRLVEKQRAAEQEMAAMLGSKYPKWEEYQGTAAARQQVNQLRTSLDSGGNPLSEEQAQSLVTAFAAEQSRSVRDEREWMSSAAAADSPNLIQESMQRALKVQRRLVDVAVPHLNSAQLAQFRRQVDQQEQMLQATMGMLGGQGPTP